MGFISLCDISLFDSYDIDIKKSNSLEFSFDSLGYIAIRYNGDLRLTNITDIQSVTTFRETKLKFSEVNKK